MSARVLRVMELGRQAYRPVLALQEQLVAERVAGTVGDTLILVEHDPVYTLGRRALAHHVVASAEQLARLGIEVVPTARGGDVTYHGPGQLVGYPIVNLGEHGAIWFVERLEEAIIDTLRVFGIAGVRDAANRGVWVDGDKVAAIGVRITRRVTQHGFALNVRPDMSHYAGIVPCGLHDRGVTSLERLRCAATMEEIQRVFCREFQRVFAYTEAVRVASPLPARERGAGAA